MLTGILVNFWKFTQNVLMVSNWNKSSFCLQERTIATGRIIYCISWLIPTTYKPPNELITDSTVKEVYFSRKWMSMLLVRQVRVVENSFQEGLWTKRVVEKLIRGRLLEKSKDWLTFILKLSEKVCLWENCGKEKTVEVKFEWWI